MDVKKSVFDVAWTPERREFRIRRIRVPYSLLQNTRKLYAATLSLTIVRCLLQARLVTWRTLGVKSDRQQQLPTSKMASVTSVQSELSCSLRKAGNRLHVVSGQQG